MSYRKVLIIRLSALGDVAMTIPVVYSVCRAYPETTFVMLTQKVASQLFINAPRNLQVVVADVKGRHKGFVGLYHLAREVRRLSIDAVADLHDVLRTKVLRFFFKLWGIRVAVIDKGRKDKQELTSRRAKVLRPLRSSFERYGEVFVSLGVSFVPNFVSLYDEGVGDEGLYSELTPPKSSGERWIGVAPFAKHKGKIYPLDRMEKVVSKLSEESRVKIFLFGSGDREREILSLWRERYPGVISLADKRYGFAVELSLMSRLDVMISMDSANMHLASLVEVPVVSVWGATHPYCGFLGWRQSDSGVVELPLDCRPCSVFGNKPCYRKDYACLEIAPETIVDRVKSLETLIKEK